MGTADMEWAMADTVDTVDTDMAIRVTGMDMPIRMGMDMVLTGWIQRTPPATWELMPPQRPDFQAARWRRLSPFRRAALRPRLLAGLSSRERRLSRPATTRGPFTTGDTTLLMTRTIPWSS